MESIDKVEIGGLTFYSTKGLAQVLDTSVVNVRYWKMALALPHHVFGLNDWFEKSEVQRWLGPDNLVPTKNNRKQKVGWPK